ncbi:SRPBCC family protein, partial [Acinetobacter faecalis]|nr:SRPBCC family protein [Acinetobacter faecalis]MDY6530027.1 SRPBCC family protein [Acinetobacter faecalis]
TIELQMRLPFVSKLILAQLKSGIKLGFSKLAKTV